MIMNHSKKIILTTLNHTPLSSWLRRLSLHSDKDLVHCKSLSHCEISISKETKVVIIDNYFNDDCSEALQKVWVNKFKAMRKDIKVYFLSPNYYADNERSISQKVYTSNLDEKVLRYIRSTIADLAPPKLKIAS